LIGGKSTRFGSDKGLFKFQGKSLVDYQLDTLSRFEYDIFLVANSKQQVQHYINEIDVKKVMGFVIDDDDLALKQESRSPLIGLYSAFKELKNLEYEKVLVLPCDTPLVKFEVIDFIIKQCKKFDCCIPKWNNNLLEPLLAIYPIENAYETSRRNIIETQYKLTKIIGINWKTNYISIEQDIKKIDPNLLSFKNINNREDIKKM
jgi:molybdopterin-guanine dinucleotide biosynthesis protein A